MMKRMLTAVINFYPMEPVVYGVGLICLIVILACSCTDTRLTRELVWPGDAATGEPDRIVIQWPVGVEAAKVYSLDVDGRCMSTAPLAPIAPEMDVK